MGILVFWCLCHPFFLSLFSSFTSRLRSLASDILSSLSLSLPYIFPSLSLCYTLATPLALFPELSLASVTL